MIIITTDSDLTNPTSRLEDLRLTDLKEDVYLASTRAEDVYFWRQGITKALKRRNAPLVVPEWIANLKGVDA